MKVTKIIANRENIEFLTDTITEKQALVVCYSPAMGKAVKVCQSEAVSVEGKYVIPRFYEKEDLLCSRFELTVDGEVLVGKKYVITIPASVKSLTRLSILAVISLFIK